MIPTIIYLLIKNFRNNHPERYQLLTRKLLQFSKYPLLLIISISSTSFHNSSERLLKYSIQRNGKEVGQLHLTELQLHTKTILRLQTQVKTRMLFNFNASTREESVFDNGIMVFSSIVRTINGREKLNRQTKSQNNQYMVRTGNHNEKLVRYPIRFNMLSLYINEPHHITEIYSDNFKQFLPIVRVEPHRYKIVFPDGSFNEYLYQGGVCSRIKINHSLYSAEVVLLN